MNRLALNLFWGIALLAQLFLPGCQSESATLPSRQGPSGEIRVEATKNAVPEYVLEVLTYVRQHQKAPQGYVGGRQFENRERRLPQKSSNGQRIQYREWDVHPKTRGTPRGAERLVTGSDGSAWFTKDHYKSFLNIHHAAH